ncbi:MAG: cell division protein FtsL [Candidatus Glassbacteria bacterium]|nr:cell division protein FtsL [Candidatus Glassbacteria bacterium]
MNPYVSAYKKNSAVRQTRIRRDRFSAAITLVFLALTVSFFLVYKRTLGQQLVYQVQQMHSIHDDLITENSVLLAQKQAYLSRERITAYARERLGLDFPAAERIRWVKLEAAADQGSSGAASP